MLMLVNGSEYQKSLGIFGSLNLTSLHHGLTVLGPSLYAGTQRRPPLSGRRPGQLARGHLSQEAPFHHRGRFRRPGPAGRALGVPGARGRPTISAKGWAGGSGRKTSATSLRGTARGRPSAHCD